MSNSTFARKLALAEPHTQHHDFPAECCWSSREKKLSWGFPSPLLMASVKPNHLSMSSRMSWKVHSKVNSAARQVDKSFSVSIFLTQNTVKMGSGNHTINSDDLTWMRILRPLIVIIIVCAIIRVHFLCEKMCQQQASKHLTSIA